MKIKGFYILTRRSVIRILAILGIAVGSLYAETTAESKVFSSRVEDVQVELISLKKRLPEDSSRAQLPDVQYLEYKSVYLEAKRYNKEHGNPAKTDATGRVPPVAAGSANGSFAKTRRGGVSAYAGKTVAGFAVNRESTRLVANGRTFSPSHKADWDLIDQIITAANNCQHDFRIILSTKCYNALSPDGRVVADLYAEREVHKGKGNAKYTGLARLK